MNIVCNRDDLNYAVSLTARAASSKDILETLGGILLEADNNTLKMTASNLEFTVQCSIECDVKETGSVILPATVFSDIVKKSVVDKLSIKVDYNNYRTTIKSDKFKMELAGIPGVEYPNVASGLYSLGLTLDSLQLYKMLEKTIYAAAKDDMRPIFTGVLLELQEDSIRMSATDGFRITSVKRECYYKGENKRLVLPSKNFQEIMRLLQSIECEDIELSFGNGNIMLDIGGVIVYSKLIEGQYPDIVQYLPDNFHTTVNILKSELQASLDRAALIIRDNQNGVVSLDSNEDQLIVYGKSSELGQHTEIINVDREGEPVKVSFTLRYLQDLVRHISTETVIMRFAEKYNMLVANPENDDSSFALLMPVAGRN